MGVCTGLASAVFAIYPGKPFGPSLYSPGSCLPSPTLSASFLASFAAMALVSLGYRWANAVRCEEGQGAAGARSYDGAGRTGFALGVLDRRPGVGLLVQVAEVELGAAVVVPAGNAGWFAGLEPEHPAKGRKTTEGTAVNTTAAVAMATAPCANR